MPSNFDATYANLVVGCSKLDSLSVAVEKYFMLFLIEILFHLCRLLSRSTVDQDAVPEMYAP